MKKLFFLIFIAISLNAITIKQGWNLIGTNKQISSSEFIDNSQETIWVYDGSTWDYFTSTKEGTIQAGQGFWLESSSVKSYNFTTSTSSEKSLSNEWELISPVQSALDITTKQNIAYAWKFTGGDDGVWKLYNPSQTTQGDFQTFSTVDIGEGVWIKSTNASIGNTPVYIKNGDFGTVTKTAANVSNVLELYSQVQDLYDFTFEISDVDKTTFAITIVMTKDNKDYTYSIAVVDSNDPYVTLSKADGSSLGTYNVESPVLEFTNNDTKLKLNFHKVVKYLISAGYYSFEDMKSRMTTKTTYKYEVQVTNINIVGTSTNKVQGTLEIK